MQGVYTYTPETNHVSTEYSVATVFWLCIIHETYKAISNVKFLYFCIIIIIIILILLCLLSQSFSSWFFYSTSCHPHRSGFKFQTAVLFVACVTFHV